MSELFFSAKEVGQLHQLLVKLREELVSRFPPVAETRGVIRGPSEGELSVANETWMFKAHGLGVQFTSQKSGVVVDAHRDISLPIQGVDSWQLCTYLQSKSTDIEVDDKSVDDRLKSLHSNGVLRRIEPDLYALSD